MGDASAASIGIEPSINCNRKSHGPPMELNDGRVTTGKSNKQGNSSLPKRKRAGRNLEMIP
jgi:hypothetical protein